MDDDSIATVQEERETTTGGPPPESTSCSRDVRVEGGEPPRLVELPPARVMPSLTVEHERAHVGVACHGQPGRAHVRLQVQGPFEGQGTLTWAPGPALVAYGQPDGGAPLESTTFTAEALAAPVDVFLEAVDDAGAFVKRVRLTFSVGGEAPDCGADVTWLSPPPPEPEEALVTFFDGSDRVDVPRAALGTVADDVALALAERLQLREPLGALRRLHDPADHRLTPLFCCGLGPLAGLLVRTCHRWLKDAPEAPGAPLVAGQVVVNHRSAVKKLRKRLLRYLDALGPVFAACPAEATCVLRAAGTGSDTHKKGQQVFVVTLGVAGDARRLQKLVYKPRDERISYALIGDTAAVVREGARYVASTGPEDDRRRQSAAELINAWLQAAGVATRLATLRVLPGEPEADRLLADPSKLVRSSYGFVEFVSSGLADDRTVDGPDDARLTGFFRDYGAVCALAHLFAIDDLHFENLRIRRHRPLITDIEIAFRPVRRRTRYNGLLSAGLGPPFVTWKEAGERFKAADLTSRLFFADGSPVELHEHDHARDALLEGWQHVLEAVGGHPQDLIAGVEGHRPILVRVLPQATPTYGARLETFVEALLGSGDPDEAFQARRAPCLADDERTLAYVLEKAWAEYCKGTPLPRQQGYFVRLQLGGHRPDDVATSGDPGLILQVLEKVLARAPGVRGWAPLCSPTFALETRQHDFRDYEVLDFPAYYADVERPELFNARGEAVVLDDTLAPGRLTAFAQAPWSWLQVEIADLAAGGTRGELCAQLAEDLAAAVEIYERETLPAAENVVFKV